MKTKACSRQREQRERRAAGCGWCSRVRVVQQGAGGGAGGGAVPASSPRGWRQTRLRSPAPLRGTLRTRCPRARRRGSASSPRRPPAGPLSTRGSSPSLAHLPPSPLRLPEPSLSLHTGRNGRPTWGEPARGMPAPSATPRLHLGYTSATPRLHLGYTSATSRPWDAGVQQRASKRVFLERHPDPVQPEAGGRASATLAPRRLSRPAKLTARTSPRRETRSRAPRCRRRLAPTRGRAPASPSR